MKDRKKCEPRQKDPLLGICPRGATIYIPFNDLGQVIDGEPGTRTKFWSRHPISVFEGQPFREVLVALSSVWAECVWTLGVSRVHPVWHEGRQHRSANRARGGMPQTFAPRRRPWLPPALHDMLRRPSEAYVRRKCSHASLAFMAPRLGLLQLAILQRPRGPGRSGLLQQDRRGRTVGQWFDGHNQRVPNRSR